MTNNDKLITIQKINRLLDGLNETDKYDAGLLDYLYICLTDYAVARYRDTNNFNLKYYLTKGKILTKPNIDHIDDLNDADDFGDDE